jgi:CDP-6-deoxy-D-xylo-4-hexulose-3-dehydrase
MNKGANLRVPVTGQLTDIEETEAVNECLDAKQYAPGKRVEQFEHTFAQFVGKKYGVFVNSGSSANLLAVTAKFTQGLNIGVTLPAVSFPTTISPYLQNNIAVQVEDVELDTLVPDHYNTFGVHTLGNYSEVYGLEDSCDAMFSGMYQASLQTFSFYPAHFMTTGEGGMVTTDDKSLYLLMRSLRDWGRDCICKSGEDDTCGRRFDQQIGNMPWGYDHKYIYTRIGYNLNGSEMSAAMGIAQLKKLPGFLEIRRRNFRLLYDGLKKYADIFVMPREVIPNTAWFAFPLTIKEEAKFSRRDIVKHLQDNGIGTRPIMAGNIARQPAFIGKVTQSGPLTNADIITEQSFYIGCWHGLAVEQVEYTIDTICKFVEG